MLEKRAIYTYDFHHPLQNLNANTKPFKNPEEVFACQFSNAYQERFHKIHSGTQKQETLFVREVPVSGNGIADLLVVSWDKSSLDGERKLEELETNELSVRAFEFKISDWKKGLMQAHRYKYFSNASILVISRSLMANARASIAVFKTLRVGLWGFDMESQIIDCLYTPRPKRQQIPRHGARALECAWRACSL